jgi:hypothetical protein
MPRLARILVFSLVCFLSLAIAISGALDVPKAVRIGVALLEFAGALAAFKLSDPSTVQLVIEKLARLLTVSVE